MYNEPYKSRAAPLLKQGEAGLDSGLDSYNEKSTVPGNQYGAKNSASCALRDSNPGQID